MKYFIIQENFSQELAEKFTAFVNENEGQITVYLSSDGGEIVPSQMIEATINDDSSRFKLVALGCISSCAFWLFFSAKCQKTMMPDTAGIYHLAGFHCRVMSNGKLGTGVEKLALKSIKETHPDELEFCKEIGMNGKEIRSFSKGEDVFFTPKRMSELFTFVNSKLP